MEVMRGLRLLLALGICLNAQELVIRTTVPLILVPVSVTDAQGKTIDGLGESDFELLDNGKPVRAVLETSNQPIALIVAVQTSGISGPALAKVQKIGSMFGPLLVGEGGISAILTYSENVKVFQDFTKGGDEFAARMKKIVPDGSGGRMNDAVVEAVKMFGSRPKYRRVLVVIGEAKDRGSQAKLEEAITKAQAANVTIYPVTYSVYSTSFTSRGDERFAGTDKRVYQQGGGLDLLAVFGEIGRMGAQNAGEALAKYTGGERVSFTKLVGLEKVIAKVGEDLHSQYLLSFLADGAATKSYHELQVRVGRSGASVRARPGYWLE